MDLNTAKQAEQKAWEAYDKICKEHEQIIEEMNKQLELKREIVMNKWCEASRMVDKLIYE